LQFFWGTCYKNLYETIKGFSIILELHFFLINVLGSIMIYSYLPLFLQFYIYNSLRLFCSIRIVMDIGTQDLLLNLLSEIHIMLQVWHFYF
jgi:hypothetical protein